MKELITIPVENIPVFKGVVKDVEKHGKKSVAFNLFRNLIKLADTCNLEVAFNCQTYESVVVYSKNEPDQEQINSIPLMDATIRGMLKVVYETLDHLAEPEKCEMPFGRPVYLYIVD